jgi:protein TonB
MFENSLVASQINHVSPRTRWTAIASIVLQCSVALLAILLPLLHPEIPIFHVEAPRLLMPLKPRPLVHVEQVQKTASPASSVATSAVARVFTMPSKLHSQSTSADEPPSITTATMSASSGFPEGLAITGEGHGVPVSVAPARPAAGPVRISSGISQGMLLAPIRPIYPSIARAAGVQGVVMVEAVISRTGTIESVRVISGPALLQGAAVEAIRSARYQPYQLNATPTEVQTTFTVNFRIGD